MPYIKEDQTGVYVMAKEAHHQLGDVSRDDFDLALVFMEDDDNLYGQWAFGYGFINVRFPKTSVKELTKKDIKKYNGMGIAVAGEFRGRIDIDEDALWRSK